jgi:uncharacterized protein YndB with AHSA1/START domain
MELHQTISRQFVLNAKPEEVWEALTNAELTKQFFFNAQVQSEWQKGSPITWTGTKKGKLFQAKGSVIVFEKNKQLKHTFLELHSGAEDVSTNYIHITYFLEAKYKGTELEIDFENFNDDHHRCSFMAKTWDNTVIPGLKRLFPAQD